MAPLRTRQPETNEARRVPSVEEAFMGRFLSRAALIVYVLPVAAVAHAQTVDDLVAKNLQAKGGPEKWKAVTSVKMTGKVTMQGKELPIVVYAKRPNSNRQEIGPPEMHVVQAFDGSSAWAMVGTQPPSELPGAAAEMMKNGADFDGALIDYKAKGHTIELIGKEKLEDKEAYHLKVTMKGGQMVQHYYLDATSGIELKTVSEADLAGSGQRQTIETRMSNYQQVNGIMVPHTISQLMNGKPVAQMTIDKVEFNPTIDDDMFRMPKK
jgi:outer membrane lipoprotein-sorting protein